jgi:hypothetical protein
VHYAAQVGSFEPDDTTLLLVNVDGPYQKFVPVFGSLVWTRRSTQRLRNLVDCVAELDDGFQVAPSG